ncbi:MAG: hypothetical protein GY771_02455 [bacterium]|nr:hypothetical protein [bacterium]
MTSKPILSAFLLVTLLLACDKTPVTAPTEQTPGTTIKALADAVNNGDAGTYLNFLTDEYIFTSTVNGSEEEYGRIADFEAVNALIVGANDYGLTVEWQNIPTPPSDFAEFTTSVFYQWYAETADFAYCAEGSGEITFERAGSYELTADNWSIAAWDDDNTGETTSMPDFAPVTLGELKAAFE